MSTVPSRGRVLLLTENAPVPSDRRVWNESRALSRAGYEVVVVCAQGADRHQAPFEVIEGIEIHRYPVTQSGGGPLHYVREYAQAVRGIRRLTRQLARERGFDVVHAGNPPDFLLLGAVGLRRRGARLIFDHHDAVPELCLTRFGRAGRLGYAVALVMEQIAYRLADVVIVTNDSFRRLALTRGRRRAQDVFVVRNGPDLERFRPTEPDPSLRAGRAHLLAYLGEMAPQDGIDYLLSSLAVLRRHRDDWRAILIGDGEAVEDMRALAHRLDLDDHVEFAGWRYDADIRRMLSTADVCLVPDPPSPTGKISSLVKIPEYLAMGRAVVAYDLPESRVSAGDAAVYARPGDVQDFAACIDRLLRDPPKRSEMGRRGTARAQERLAWQRSAAVLLEAYRHALEHDRAGGRARSDGRHAHTVAGAPTAAATRSPARPSP